MAPAVKRVSIIIPVRNEEKRIEGALQEYGSFFRELKKKGILDFEILFVINNTSDRTEEIIKKFQRKFNEITYLNFKQGGKGFAIMEGFKDALKRDNDFIGFVDCDLSTYPNSFYDLMKNISPDCDGVIASRAIKGAKANFSIKRKITHKGFNFVVRSFFLFPYRDTQCGAKLFRREVIKKITSELRITQWAFDVNLLYLCRKYKFKIKEIPTVWEDKEGSKISNIPKVTIQMFLGVVRLRIIYSAFESLARQMRFIAYWMDKLVNK